MGPEVGRFVADDRVFLARAVLLGTLPRPNGFASRLVLGEDQPATVIVNSCWMQVPVLAIVWYLVCR